MNNISLNSGEQQSLISSLADYMAEGKNFLEACQLQLNDFKREENKENPESALADTACYGAVAAELRNTTIEEISEQSIQNTLKAIPKFGVLISAS